MTKVCFFVVFRQSPERGRMKERNSGRTHEVLQLFRIITSSRGVIIFGVAIGLFVLFVFTTEGAFASIRVIDIMCTSASELGLIVLSVALLIIAGEFDLSVGSVSALGALMMTVLYQLGLNPFLAMGIILGGGMITGAINGLVAMKLGLPSFIVTLGAMMAWRGVIYVITEGVTIGFHVRETHPAFYSVLLADIGAVSAPLLWLIVTAIMLTLLLNFHRFGNHVYATGGNREAARAMGININKIKVICFMIVGSLAAFSGVMQVTRIRGFHAQQGMETPLMAIAAVVIGGTALSGGVGTIVGAALGVLIITFLKFGLILSGVSGFWYQVLLGLIIVVVATINMTLERRRK